MDNTEEVITTIFIGTFVATFLRKTSRVLQALVMCKECLILLNNKALAKTKEIVDIAYTRIYLSLFKTYCLLNDHTSGIECGRKLLHFLRVCGEKSKEGQVTCKLAKLYHLQSQYNEAKRLYKEALSIMVEIGDRQRQSTCYENLGTVYGSLCEYGKAKTY